MIFGIGTDITEIARIESAVGKYGERFAHKIFTQSEIDYCESFKLGKFQHYAARFAAKEAFSKAVGTGIVDGFKFNEISILNEENGKPLIELSGSMLEKYGKYNIYISLSHTDTLAVAMIVLEETN